MHVRLYVHEVQTSIVTNGARVKVGQVVIVIDLHVSTSFGDKGQVREAQPANSQHTTQHRYVRSARPV